MVVSLQWTIVVEASAQVSWPLSTHVASVVGVPELARAEASTINGTSAISGAAVGEEVGVGTVPAGAGLALWAGGLLSVEVDAEVVAGEALPRRCWWVGLPGSGPTTVIRCSRSACSRWIRKVYPPSTRCSAGRRARCSSRVGVHAQASRSAVAAAPVLLDHAGQRVADGAGEFFQSGAHRLGDQFQAGQVAHRSQDVGGVGVLGGALACQPGVLQPGQGEAEEAVRPSRGYQSAKSSSLHRPSRRSRTHIAVVPVGLLDRAIRALNTGTSAPRRRRTDISRSLPVSRASYTRETDAPS
ncbi:hypothetical protein [Kitasatospora sp. CB01950]|uniref:hypothetical protein n=1 Tax=Kitasatospora sp. CB01950 TaxID=1703930 RepID=UPI00093D8E86|nr:hypothetical protein [Kitasatospora sp. CB01950]OKI97209.1 hypothetical protein AMK19_32370 [Kitasatospora sp. CB01950]